MNHQRMLVQVLSLCLAGCSATGVSYGGGPVTGTWGGVHASLALTGDGGTITYDCAHGAVQAPVILGSDGTFDVAGVHVREHGGPVRIDEVPDSVAARYVGQVHGDHMTLRVLAGPDTLGPFELELGATPQLFRCL
jgi:hypothetical protein